VSLGTCYLVIALRKPQFDPAVVAPHLAWLEDLRARGMLALTGGFADGTGGAYVLTGLDSIEAARVLVATDPLALTGSSSLAVHEWNTR
jgi:uncharacterized protein YciI